MRKLVKLLFAGCLVGALAAMLVSVWKLGWRNENAWGTVAAALAVIAAVMSGWSSQRVLELQEDAQEPDPVPLLDLRSRYQLAQFRITNTGGSAAYDVRVKWGNPPLRTAKQEDVRLGVVVPIPVIPAGSSASMVMGNSQHFLAEHPDTTRHGTIEFRNASGRKFRRAFVLSAEHERGALVHDEEATKAQFEMQKIPERLAEISVQVAAVAAAFGKAFEPDNANGEHSNIEEV